MNTVIDMAVRWHHGYGNSPRLAMVLDEYLHFDERIWTAFPRGDEGVFWISRHQPMVSFMFEPTPPPGRENTKYGGALGGVINLVDGTTHNARQCWSSNEGAIHNLRIKNEHAAALIPEDIVDITVYDKSHWSLTGMAGLFWDKSWVEEQLARYLPTIELFPCAVAGGMLDAAQTAVVGGVPSNLMWVPYPKEMPGQKPKQGSEIDLITSGEYKERMRR